MLIIMITLLMLQKEKGLAESLFVCELVDKSMTSLSLSLAKIRLSLSSTCLIIISKRLEKLCWF